MSCRARGWSARRTFRTPWPTAFLKFPTRPAYLGAGHPTQGSVKVAFDAAQPLPVTTQRRSSALYGLALARPSATSRDLEAYHAPTGDELAQDYDKGQGARGKEAAGVTGLRIAHGSDKKSPQE